MISSCQLAGRNHENDVRAPVQVMDKHLAALAQDHVETKFVRVSRPLTMSPHSNGHVTATHLLMSLLCHGPSEEIPALSHKEIWPRSTIRLHSSCGDT